MTKKINWLLILQGWAMLWVIIGHSFLGEVGTGPVWENSLTNFAYSFHMPLFMLVSGWLFYKTRLKVIENENENEGEWTYKKILKDKVMRLLLPGFVFSVFAFILKIAFSNEMSRTPGLSLSEILHQYLYPFDNPFRELWFIITLFGFFLLTPLWKFLLKNKFRMYFMLPVLITLNFCHPQTELLCIGRMFEYGIWFYAGVIMAKTEIVDLCFKRHSLLTLIIGIIIYCVGFEIDKFVTTGGGILFSFALALLLDKYLPRIFSSFRSYTYQIFLIGIFAQMAIKIIYRYIDFPYVLAYILCILAGLYVPVVVSRFLQHLNWSALLLCVGLRK